MEKVNIDAKWIWAEDNSCKNDWVAFRKAFHIVSIPERCILNVAAESKYWLYINGDLVVFEGGLNRGPFDGCGYCDEIDISKHLKTGDNLIVFLVWYWGNAGRNNIDIGSSGLIFESKELGIHSDYSCKVKRLTAYTDTKEPKPSYLYGGHNIGYDANFELVDFDKQDFDDSNWANSTCFGDYPALPFGEYYKRAIPLIAFKDIKPYERFTMKNNRYICKLPYAAQFTPYFKLTANGGEIIDIRSDRYAVNGGPGDEIHQYNGHRVEYICKKGINEFEALDWLFGEEVIYTISEGVENITLGFRESHYDTNVNGSFHCDNNSINKLMDKCTRTLTVCMRDNFMDCPDRERGQWIGDVSVQVPQVFYRLDGNAVLLVKKAIMDFINLRKGDVLVGNVPGVCFCELPPQSLNAISELGMISSYYNFTGDLEILKLCFEPMMKYLMLWEMGCDGLVIPRQGDWRWFDHLYNIDEAVLENAWYYSALNFCGKVSTLIGSNEHENFISSRKKSIHDVFDKLFWKGTFYSSGSFVDDRANALAVLSGLASEEKHESIMKILVSVFNATTYMEAYVLEALCVMGYTNEAYKRMMSRYYNLIENENSTLWEDFNILGTKNHAWSGGPLTILYKYFVGIETLDGFNSITITPDLRQFENLESKVVHKNGELIFKAVKNDDGFILEINNNSNSPCSLIIEAAKFNLNIISNINNEEINSGSYNLKLKSGENKISVR